MSGALLTAAVVFSLGWVALRTPEGRRLQGVDQGAGVLAGCLVGGRLGYVLANWAYYQAHQAEMAQIWLGGLSGIGAALGGVLALLLVARLTRQKLPVLVDRMLPILILLSAAGWLSCWSDGCAYGLRVKVILWGLLTPDELGQVAWRFPVQPTGALLAVIIPWRVEATLTSRHPQGVAAGWLGALSLFWSALAWFGLSFLRGDPTLLWNGMRPEAWGAVGLIGISLIIMILIWKEP